MVTLFEGQKQSLYKLQKEIKVGKDVLYKYARGERKIKEMPMKIILAIACAEKIEVNILYEKMLKAEKKRAS